MTTKRESARIARLLKDRQILGDLRKHFTGYEPAAGYSLTPDKLYEIPYWKKRAMRVKHKKLQELLKVPFKDFIVPSDDISRKALKKFTGENLRNMKHFIVAKPSAESKVRVVDGDVQLRTQFPGEVAFTERYFMFPTAPRSHSQMLKSFDRIYKKMPPGMYVLQTDTYGDTGGIIEREQLRGELQRLLEAYDKAKYGEHRFMYRIAGFRWMSTTVKGARMQMNKRDEAREGMREYNRKRAAERRQAIAKMKKPKRK